MARYHISPKTGNPSLCRAESGKCPFGKDDVHFSSREEARTAFEQLRASVPNGFKKTRRFNPKHIAPDTFLTDEGEQKIKIYGIHCPDCDAVPSAYNAAMLTTSDYAYCECGNQYLIEDADIRFEPDNPSYKFLDKKEVVNAVWYHATSRENWPRIEVSRFSPAPHEFHMGTFDAAMDRGQTDYADHSSNSKGFWLYEVKLNDDVQIADEIAEDKNTNVINPRDHVTDVKRYVNRWEDMSSISLAVKPEKFQVLKRRWVTPEEAYRRYSVYNVRPSYMRSD